MPLKTHRDEIPSLNLTPMIDIIFQLIIFFMVGTKFSEFDEQAIDLEVPRVASSGTLSPAPEKQVVNVFRDGTLTLNHRPVSLDDLQRQLAARKAEYADLGVLVRGAADGPFQNIAEVLYACRMAGIGELAISVKMESQEE